MTTSERAQRLAGLSREERPACSNGCARSASGWSGRRPPGAAGRPPPLSFAAAAPLVPRPAGAGDRVYNISHPVLAPGPLDAAALERGAERRDRAPPRGAAHHLRARGRRSRCSWSLPPAASPLPAGRPVGLARRPTAREERGAAARWPRRGRRPPFDLARGPLFRAPLLRLAAPEHVLLLGMHHIVSDGWSMGVLVRELAALYARLPRGPAARRCRRCRSSTPTSPSGSARWLPGERSSAQLAYWREQLAGAAAGARAAHRPPAAGGARPPRRAHRDLAVPPELSARAARARPRARGPRPFMVLLAAFAGLLSAADAGRTTCWSARRSPTARARDRGADRLLRQHPGARAPTSPATRRSPSCWPRVRRGGPGRLRPPGPAVREAGRGAAAGARPQPHAALPGDVRAAERADAGRARPTASSSSVGRPARRGRPSSTSPPPSRSCRPAGSPQLRRTAPTSSTAATVERLARALRPSCSARRRRAAAPALRAAAAARRARPPSCSSSGPRATAAGRGLAGAAASARRERGRADARRAAGRSRSARRRGADLRRARGPARDRAGPPPAALGVGPEVRVGVCLERSPDLVVALLASSRPAAPACRSTPPTRPSGWPSCSPTPGAPLVADPRRARAAPPCREGAPRRPARRSCGRRAGGAAAGRRASRCPASARLRDLHLGLDRPARRGWW